VIEYAERCEKERAAYQKKISKVPEGKRYYIDETGIYKFMYREYAKAPRGEKVHGRISGKRYRKVNIVAALCGDEIIERHEYGCSMNSRLFEFWFMLLLKVIPRGSVLIMDNARFHRKKELKKMAKAVGCRVVFLPAYSPDFNPIEHVWGNLKRWLRNNLVNYGSISDACMVFFKVG